MLRSLIRITALRAAAIGAAFLIPAVSTAAPAQAPTDIVETIVTVPASDADRAAIQGALTAIVKSLPVPASGFRLAVDGATDEVGRVVLKVEGSKPWGPLDASAERIYDRTDASDDEDRTLEIRVSVNGTKGLSTGLASVGGTPRPFAIPGALALEQTLTGIEEGGGTGESGSRVALPLDKDQVERTVALLRIYIVPKSLEGRLRALASGSPEFPAFDPGFTPSSRRAVVRALVVEIHGQKRDVEVYARRVQADQLRRRLQT
jgi:hypothetical protein